MVVNGLLNVQSVKHHKIPIISPGLIEFRRGFGQAGAYQKDKKRLETSC